MADTKISSLSAVTDVQTTDEFVLARAGTTKKITGANLEAEIGGGSGGLFDAYALLRDQKSANTQGGTPTTAAWTKHALGTEVFDPAGIVSVSSDVFTLAAGDYFVRGWAACYMSDRFKIKVRNTSDSTDAVIGMSGVSTGGGNDGAVVMLTGRVSIAGTKNFELQYYCENSSGSGRGLGVETNFSVVEVYAELEIWREA